MAPDPLQTCLRWMPSHKPLEEHVKVHLHTEERKEERKGKERGSPRSPTETKPTENPETTTPTNNNNTTQCRPPESTGRALAPESAKSVKDVQRAEDTRGGPGGMGFPRARGPLGPRPGRGGRLVGTHRAQRGRVPLQDAPELGIIDGSVSANNLQGTWCQQK